MLLKFRRDQFRLSPADQESGSRPCRCRNAKAVRKVDGGKKAFKETLYLDLADSSVCLALARAGLEFLAPEPRSPSRITREFPFWQRKPTAATLIAEAAGCSVLE